MSSTQQGKADFVKNQNPTIVRPQTTSQKARDGSRYSRGQQASQQSNRLPAVPPCKSAPEMEDLREEYWGKDDFSGVEDSDREPFMTYLRKYAKQQGEQKNYKDAKIARKMILKLQEGGPRSVSKNENESEISEFEEKKKSLDEACLKRYQDSNDKSDKLSQNLEERQKKELEQFETSWAEKIPVRYRKVSTRILNFQKIEENLTLLQEFEDAEQVHSMVDNMAKNLLDEKQAAIIRDYQLAKVALFNQHEREKETREDERQKKLDADFVKNERDLNRFLLRRRILELKNQERGKKPPDVERESIYYVSSNRGGSEEVAKKLQPFILDVKAPNAEANKEKNDKFKTDTVRKRNYFKLKSDPIPLAPQFNPKYQNSQKQKKEEE